MVPYFWQSYMYYNSFKNIYRSFDEIYLDKISIIELVYVYLYR